ncbi:hypothetical protein P2318_16860 [Myxococcaceae bacterium GXIMD 01537]
MRTLNLTSSRRPLVGLAAAVALALAPVACTKEPGPPSEAYAQAHQRFSKLYAQQLDQAYLDPAMTDIETQLQQVPADSVDAPSAQELLSRIREGRARQESQQKEKQAALESARTAPPMPSSGAVEEAPPPRAPEPPDAGTAADAGTSKGPQPGTPASELVAGFNGCFRRGEQVNIEGRGFRERWDMVDRLACRLEFPALAEQVLIIEGGKVLAVLPKGSLTVTSERPAVPDAGR